MDSSTAGPQPIRRLQQSVINRIAAGEIIHRPSSALKEILENSLDAGATSIRITIKDGGMKLLQIQDNGCGIRKADLPILAERFTTSKISAFQDLEKLTTYGFRGEALASISYVSNLTVTTKTKADACAWKASYVDGAMIVKDGSAAEPKACAGNDGTIITVENLFYNTPARLSALRGSSEEYSRILDVVTKYAIHNPQISFSCKKSGSAAPDLTTPSESSVRNTIRHTYGQTIAKDLIHTEIKPLTVDEEEVMDVDEDDVTKWSAEAYFTNPNYQAKKTVFLLFINHRLVESSRMKKALESIYVGILPKGSSPFVYLSLEINPRLVDVNVHPTKREVHFLDEENITQRISDVIHDVLVGQNQSKTFENKGKERETLDEAEYGDSGGHSEARTPSTVATKKTPSHHKVRTSMQDRTLDSMFPILDPSQAVSVESDPARPPAKVPDIKLSECNLGSVLQLRDEVANAKHQELTEIIQKHIFVGIVDLSRCLSLIQHSKKLYLINHGALCEEFFYQLGLIQFGNYNRIRLEPAPSLRKLVNLAVNAEEGTRNSKLSKEEIVDRIVNIIMIRRDMLQDYFLLEITEGGLVKSLPLLLKGYTPNLDKLPLFLMRLGPQVNWHSETECFESFLRELAYFYVPEPLFSEAQNESGKADTSDSEKATVTAIRWQIQHLLFPAMARYMVPPRTLLDRDVVQVANLPDLYRVFERC
ncbi:DNA binding protein [Irpex rosettiformis]|uniref:DNA binding protein n=1 Tax=Irpex rosettiformis TaxID=378272 RepID=A0ACB8U3M7_9APHY|nr:DNA binding protein [Irpex rosettiformis]